MNPQTTSIALGLGCACAFLALCLGSLGYFQSGTAQSVGDQTPSHISKAKDEKTSALQVKTTMEIRKVVQQLADESFKTREKAAKRLLEIGEPAFLGEYGY